MTQFKIFIKDGDYGRREDGTYGYTDYVNEFDDFQAALLDFLECASNESFEDGHKVTLTFKFKKEKKGKKS